MTLPRLINSGSIAQQIAQRPNPGADLMTGVVQTVDTSTGAATVVIGGVEQDPGQWLFAPPRVGDTVLVARQNGVLFILGPTSGDPRPITGTVTDVGVGTIAVSTTIGDLRCQFFAAYTPAVDDDVPILWFGSQPVVPDKWGTVAPPPPPAPPPPAPHAPPPSSPSTGTNQFHAVDSGSWRGATRLNNSISNGNVMQGNSGFGNNSGAWFYGKIPWATLKGKTVTHCQVWLGRTQGGLFAAQTANIQQVGNNVAPAGALTFIGSATGVAIAVGQSGWFVLPNALGQAIVTNGGSLGVQATTGSPYLRLFGLSQSGSAGLLQISWRS